MLALSPLDAALGVRGLDVHWAFMYARDLDAALLQRALAATLADYPVLAGRVRVKSKTGLLQDLEVVLNDAGAGHVRASTIGDSQK